MDTKTAIRNMWTISDKPERVRCFHKIVFELGLDDAVTFWSEFWSVWSGSENLHEDIDYFPALIEHGLTLGSPLLGLDKKEVETLLAMPEVITVYRGCIDSNQNGWSWTTDREKAKWFAGRSYGSETRQVLMGTVNKMDVLAYLAGRNESEIVVNPDDVIDFTVHEQWEVPHDPRQALFYAAQSGKLFSGSNMDNMRAMMTAGHMTPTPETIAEIEQTYEFAVWADLPSKRGYLGELLRLLRLKQDDPSAVPPMSTFSL